MTTTAPRRLSTPATPAPPPRVVVDADACVPAKALLALGILTAPAVAPLLVERESVPRLALEAGAYPVDAIAAVCASAAEAGGDVIYVRSTDGYASPPEAEEAAREAVEARQGTLHVLAAGALMATGWAAVRAAETVRGGGDAAAALEAGRRAAETVQAIAMLEHPEVAGLATPGSATGAQRGSTWRVLVRVEGSALPLLGAAPSREVGLGLLRDRFGALAQEATAGALRVAVHHAGAAAAAEALATWARRHLEPAEVTIAPLTRHAATRLGPGMVGVAWLREA